MEGDVLNNQPADTGASEFVARECGSCITALRRSKEGCSQLAELESEIEKLHTQVEVEDGKNKESYQHTAPLVSIYSSEIHNLI